MFILTRSNIIEIHIFGYLVSVYSRKYFHDSTMHIATFFITLVNIKGISTAVVCND